MNVEERLKSDKKNLVDEIIICIHEYIPFQSISVLSKSSEERNIILRNEQIKEICFTGEGGLCYVMASFCLMLFGALGFSVRLISSTVTSNRSTIDSHTFVVIDGLEYENDIHLVDCGLGFPTFRAISLNFTDESPVFYDGFLEYKYIRHDGKILRMHGKGDIYKHNDPPIEGLDFIIGRWRRFYSFDLSRKYDTLFEPAQTSWKIVASGVTSFTSRPVAVCFPKKRAIRMVSNLLMIENENRELVTTILENDEEIIKAYSKYFPVFSQEVIKRALEEWHRVSLASN
ncbi:uncharacterized protein LOC124436928 isoform X2 [Xenia sp. Carnegie-2017]|nr:uncharacterized protein LOC124436928 isoform X2 [Xenia sp. Carnegie-2017]